MLILGIAACGDMYDVHEKYLKMGEETYLGIASDLEANSGFNRIELLILESMPVSFLGKDAKLQLRYPSLQIVISMIISQR